MDFSQLDPQNSLIVTASRRQARFIREKYQRYQIQQGKEAWNSLNVLPWSAFLEECWGFYVQSNQDKISTRLNKEQSQYLWQQLVINSKQAGELLNSQQAVKISYDAWRMLNQWQIDDFSFQHGDADQEAFAEWYFEYRKLLSQRNWIDSHQVGTILSENLSKIIKYLPKDIAFYGFQQLNVQQEKIIQAIKNSSNFLDFASVKKDVVRKQLLAADSQEQEFISAIRWAVEKLNDNNEQSIAILVPDLQQQRLLLERIIQRELYPEDFIEGRKGQSWHDISIAENLDSKPMVHAVLIWLKLVDSSITKSQLQSLLLTPYLYTNDESYWHATKVELEVRQSNKNFYSLNAISDLCLRYELTFDWLEKMKSLKEQSNETSSLTQFIQRVLSVLETLHWTGYKALDSYEYQLQQQFLDVVKAAAKLSPVVKTKLTWSAALNILQKYILESSYHQETPKAPIKIMGMLEAVAIEYDSVWFMSATDKILPQKSSLNPFLSKALQLKHNLPGSSQQREIEYAESILDSLLAKEELIFSYATHDGEQEQLPSPLLQKLVDRTQKHLSLDSELPEYLQQWPKGDVDVYQDDKGLPLGNDDYVAGGTGLLKTQAASPFDAYLRYRLKLYPFETDDLGISFMERGNIFHKVMQLLWQYLVSQQALINHSEDELETLVTRTITTVLNIESKHLYLLNNQGFHQAEVLRLKQRVTAALNFDKERVPFEVIATEAKREIEVGGLRLRITIDRIDRLEDGSLIIIDYKTGTPRLIDLLNDPIGEPQLLLYAISEHKEKNPVSGILFYQAHLKGDKYLGVTEESEMIKGVKALKDLANNPYADDFDSAINQWRTLLNEIAQSFKSGEAIVTDYSGNYADHYGVSRWIERDLNYQENLKRSLGATNDE